MRFLRSIRDFFIPSHTNAYRPRILGAPWLLFFFALILVTEGFLVTHLIARQSVEDFLATIIATDVIALTNEERIESALAPVVENPLLVLAAQRKAEDMATKGYFSHTSPDGTEPWRWIEDVGYRYRYAGENLAVRFVDSSDVVRAWMASPSHRANIVKGVYQDIGIGVAQGTFEGAPATFVVQFFASPYSLIAIDSGVPEQETEATSSPTAPAAVVAGEAVVVASPPAPAQLEQSFFRHIARSLAQPRATADFVLGSIAMILILTIVLGFFVHIQIQPTAMFASGTFVVLVALSFMAFNGQLLFIGGGNGQAASTVFSLAENGVIIDTESAATNL